MRDGDIVADESKVDSIIEEPRGGGDARRG